MATENPGANSPAPTAVTGEATAKAADNISMGQAAAMLFSRIEKEAAQQAKPAKAAENVAPENAEPSATETAETPAAEASIASEETPTEETATAETTEAEAPPEEGAETVHSQKISFTPEQQELFNKRIQRETAKTKAIESQMSEAKAKLAQLEAEANELRAAQTSEATKTPAQVVSFGNQPLAEVGDIPSLVKLQQSAKDAIRFVEDTLDNPRAWKTQTVTDPETGIETSTKLTTIGDRVYTEADLRASMRRAKITLEDQIPARANFLTVRQQEQQKALTQFPWLKDKSSAEYQQAQAAKRDYPWLSALPNADWIIGVQVTGMKAMEAAAKAAETAAKTATVRPKIVAKPAGDQSAVSASGAAPRAAIGSQERNALAAERARLSKKGGIGSSDAAALLLKSQQLRNSR